MKSSDKLAVFKTNKEQRMLLNKNLDLLSFGCRSKVSRALKKRLDQSVDKGYFGKRMYETINTFWVDKKNKHSDNNLIEKVKDFNVTYKKSMQKVKALKEDNQEFSVKYNQTMSNFDKFGKAKKKKMQIPFLDLVEKYKKKGYKIPDLSVKENLFDPSPLLVEENKLEELYKYISGPSTPKSCSQFTDLIFLHNLNVSLNEFIGADEETLKTLVRIKNRERSKYSDDNFKSIDQVTEENLELENEIIQLKKLIEQKLYILDNPSKKLKKFSKSCLMKKNSNRGTLKNILDSDIKFNTKKENKINYSTIAKKLVFPDNKRNHLHPTDFNNDSTYAETNPNTKRSIHRLPKNGLLNERKTQQKKVKLTIFKNKKFNTRDSQATEYNSNNSLNGSFFENAKTNGKKNLLNLPKLIKKSSKSIKSHWTENDISHEVEEGGEVSARMNKLEKVYDKINSKNFFSTADIVDYFKNHTNTHPTTYDTERKPGPNDLLRNITDLKKKVLLTNYHENFKNFVAKNGNINIDKDNLNRISHLDKQIGTLEVNLVRELMKCKMQNGG